MDHAAGKEHVLAFLWQSSIVVTLLVLPLLLLFKDKPEEYPSKGAEDLEKHKTSYSFMSDMKLLWNNKNFCRFALSYMNTYSIYTSLTAITSNLLSPYGYTPSQASMTGILFICFGLVGAFAVSIKVDKSKKYLLTYRIIVIGTLVCSLAFLITLPMGNVLALYLNNLFFGMFLVPLTPIGYSFSVEMTYPVSEAMSIGIISMMGSLMGFVLTYIATILADRSHGGDPIYVGYLFGGQMLFSLGLTYFMTEDLRMIKLGLKKGGRQSKPN